MTMNPIVPALIDDKLTDELDSEWQRKGATLSDKTAREEFGPTQDDIVRATRAGTLHYREGSMYGKGILMRFAIICFFLAALDVKPRVQFTPLGLLFCALAWFPS